MPNHWVLQGEPKVWDRPELLFIEPITTWSVTGAEGSVSDGDGVLIWIANRRPEKRGVHAVGVISGQPRRGYPRGWGTAKQRSQQTSFVTLSTFWYVLHNPVSVDELRNSAFAGHQILRMPRRTAYPCTEKEFMTAVDLVEQHGPTAIPVPPASPFADWWGSV